MGQWLLSRYGISFQSDENVLKLDSGDSSRTFWKYLKATELYKVLEWLIVYYVHFTSIYKKKK